MPHEWPTDGKRAVVDGSAHLTPDVNRYTVEVNGEPLKHHPLRDHGMANFPLSGSRGKRGDKRPRTDEHHYLVCDVGS